MKNKVAVFGIDGGTLSLVERWRNELPTLSKFMDDGFYGEMKSTTPALTCPAWPSMFTGKNPGKLGMYDFWREDGSLCQSTDYHESSLWNILNRNGISVGLLNVPLTYPPHSVNKYVICGIGSPENTNSNYMYPKELRGDLNGYRITPNVMLTLYNQEKRCLLNVADVIGKRVRAAKYLLEKYPTDLFVCVFFVSDVVQHYFWRFMDESHPRHEDRYQDVIKDVYKLIDRAIGELKLDINLVVSDHGFGASHGNFVINKWLEEQGYLSLNENHKADIIYGLRDAVLSHMNPYMVGKIARFIPRRLSDKIRVGGESRARTLDSIDWSNTTAYAVGSSSGGIYVRDERLRMEILTKLEKLGFRCRFKEDVYWGEYTKDAPDILIELGSSNYYPVSFGKSIWQDTALSGSHIPQGLFIADGLGKSDIGDISIYDVTPTVLKIFGVDIPNDIDGRALWTGCNA